MIITADQIVQINKSEYKTAIIHEGKECVSFTSFEQLEKDKFQSEEFWCAMKILDDMKIPREDNEGKTYSLVGRIKQLHNKILH